jgi:2-polyprenyl-6-methoxyphenol hydroxylase-like FAD-dependent oxidoreductase
MRDNLPTYYGDIVAKSLHTHVQLIFTARLPAYYRRRIGLIGDAGMVIQPFTGSGVFKGYNNVKDLLQSLDSHATVEDALEDWGKTQVRVGDHLLAWGEQTEQAYIWQTPDLASADAAATAAWWNASVTPPKEFSFTKDKA